MGASVAILGASGYTGAELLRLLAGHPALSLAIAAAGRAGGRAVGDVHPHLAGTDLPAFGSLEEALEADVDVAFSCLPSGALASRGGALAARVVVDLSDDFRADPEWSYGLTEFVRDDLGPRIANPGCYPTATLLALLPFARAEVIRAPVIVDAFSGVSGAGRNEVDRLLFSSADGNAGAYGTTMHRHIPEMERNLQRLGGLSTTVSFTPHLVPLTRGLVATARASIVPGLGDEEALSILRDAYRDETFVTVIDEWPQVKAVHGSNRALVSARVDLRNSLLVCSAAIDNLGKGAAGQAIQNANVVLGLEEGLGLERVGVWP